MEKIDTQCFLALRLACRPLVKCGHAELQMCKCSMGKVRITVRCYGLGLRFALSMSIGLRPRLTTIFR